MDDQAIKAHAAAAGDLAGFVETYLRGIQGEDNDKLVELFTDDSVIHHPIIGEKSAIDFFKNTVGGIAIDVGDVKKILISGNKPRAIGLVLLDTFVPPSGERTKPSTVVVLLQLNDENKATDVQVIFDTYGMR